MVLLLHAHFVLCQTFSMCLYIVVIVYYGEDLDTLCCIQLSISIVCIDITFFMLNELYSSADRLDRSSIYLSDVEKNQIAASRNGPVVDHKDTGGGNLVTENSHARLISLQGCCGSDAFQLLTDREFPMKY